MEDIDGGDGGGSPGDGSEAKFSASITIPGNSAILDDGSGAEFDVWDVDLDGGHSMPKLLEELTSNQFVGFQEPIVWSRREDENQQACNVVNVIEDEGLRTEWQAGADDGHIVPPQGNADPASMDTDDVFMDDEPLFVDPELKAGAGKMNQSEEPLELEPIFCVDTAAQITPNVEPDNVFEKENLRFKVNSSFPSMENFRMALRQYGIVRGFKVHKVKTDKSRYRAECMAEGCPWRIVARKLRDQPTVVISMIPQEHNCVSTSKLGNSMASQKWVAERIIGWLRKNPALGAKELQQKLLEEYNVEVGYSTVWCGKQKAMNNIFGFWRDSFQTLYYFRADLLSRSPGSVLEISTVIRGDGVHFDKLFMALQPCIEGFKNGCRPHLEIDSVALNGMYSGHLACACALDGHNWMYPVAWAIFGSESDDNWTWFIGELKKAIGNLPALEISTNGCKGYGGNNNVPEGFNECILNIKNMFLVDLVDRLRQMVMVLWYKRRKIGNKLSGNILPAIIQQLNEKTSCLGDLKVWKGGYQTGEVFGNFQDMTPWRHVVDLNTYTCSCGEWQLTGLPCVHALALISIETNVNLESFIHEYYSVERFKAAYCGIIPPMPDISQWPKVVTGFKLLPPSKRVTSKRKYMRKASHEPGACTQHGCMQSGELGHCENGCTLHGPVKRKRHQAETNREGKEGAH